MNAVLLPAEHATIIGERLASGARLVACLCADWCDACGEWFAQFQTAAAQYPDDCFVWIDIDAHADMVAEVDVDVMPVIVVYKNEQITHLGAIRPSIEVLSYLLRSDTALAVADVGIRQFLQEEAGELSSH